MLRAGSTSNASPAEHPGSAALAFRLAGQVVQRATQRARRGLATAPAFVSLARKGTVSLLSKTRFQKTGESETRRGVTVIVAHERFRLVGSVNDRRGSGGDDIASGALQGRGYLAALVSSSVQRCAVLHSSGTDSSGTI